MTVLLPQPLGPTRATVWPDLTRRSSPDMIWVKQSHMTVPSNHVTVTWHHSSTTCTSGLAG